MQKIMTVTILAGMLVMIAMTGVATALDAYVHPEALASTDWLEANLNDPTVRIIATADCRLPTHKDLYMAGHIPGAIYLNVISELSNRESQIPMMLPGVEDFEDLMGKLGISSGTTVVVYDDTGGLWAARLWWALRYYGHENVKLLNGGLTKWRAEQRPLETMEIAPTPTTFRASVVPHFRATIKDVKLALGEADVRIISALPKAMFDAGHIPSSANVPAPSNLDPDVMTVLPMAELKQVWSEASLRPDQLAITYCGGGYYGAFDLFILYLMGHENVTLYDGSWIEWKSTFQQYLTP